MDRYQSLRELPFTAVASALGIELSKFTPRKGGTGVVGAMPHTPYNIETESNQLQLRLGRTLALLCAGGIRPRQHRLDHEGPGYRLSTSRRIAPARRLRAYPCT